ncbi:hypothetical protein KEM55_003960 [Ascosphaera atra]|nr:hypothetical protein KEM55_003960 [Ascosphaera atra]
MTDTPQEMRGFTLLETTTPTLLAPRLGRFALPGRPTLQTPGFIATTSRGAVPHLAPDVLKEHTPIQGLYAGFEDFIERAKHDSPPIYKTPAGASEGALRRFMCVPEEMLLVMGPRRAPPVACPTPSSATAVTVMTSDGYRQLTTGQYLEAVRRLRPDVVVGLADLVLDRVPGVKRRERMVDRTHGWTVEAVQRLFGEMEEGQGRLESLYFAPLLPLSGEQQWLYTRELEQDMREHVAGFAVYDPASLAAVPESLSGLARLSLSNPKTPQDGCQRRP